MSESEEQPSSKVDVSHYGVKVPDRHVPYASELSGRVTSDLSYGREARMLIMAKAYGFSRAAMVRWALDTAWVEYMRAVGEGKIHE